MATTYVITFGWTESAVLSPVVKHGLEEGDNIFLLIPLEFEDEKSKRSINNVKSFIKAHVRGVNVKEQRVPITNFATAVKRIASILRTELEKERDVLVNLSGGMRALILETFIACMLLRGRFGTKISFTDVELEGGQGSVRVPAIPFLFMDLLSKDDLALLEFLVKRGKASLAELEIAVRKSRSTVYRKALKLEKVGFLRIKRDRKKLIISPEPHVTVLLSYYR